MAYIDIAGMETFYTSKGSGSHLIFFSDNILSSGAYKDEINYFSSQFNVIAFDYPGTGKSTHLLKYLDERQYDYWGF
jgi:hypothetical protein